MGTAVPLADTGQLEGARVDAHNATPRWRPAPVLIAMTAQAATPRMRETPCCAPSAGQVGSRPRVEASTTPAQPSDTTVAAARGPTKPASASSTGTSARAG